MVGMLALASILGPVVHTLLNVLEVGILKVFLLLYIRSDVLQLDRHHVDLCLRIVIVLFDPILEHLYHGKDEESGIFSSIAQDD